MTSHFLVADNFFDGAQDVRQAYEAHFSHPHAHTPEHQIWNYWYVPGAYAYLRTAAGKIVPPPLLTRFMQRLNSWAMETLGLTTCQSPWLSLYVDGCGQTIHNDAAAGQMGFVFSLTLWDERPFLGGETILFHPANYWQTDRMRRSGAGTSFYDLVPSQFNRLLVFDDRVIHGVQPVQGTMDPMNGRVVMHGHLRAQAIALQGALSREVAQPALQTTMEALAELTRKRLNQVNGFATLRLAIATDGRVDGLQTLCDRLLPVTPDTGPVDLYRKSVVNLVSQTRFPAADGESTLTLPVVVSG